MTLAQRSAASYLLPAIALTVVCAIPMSLTGALVVQIREDLDFSLAALGFCVAAFRGSGVLVAATLGRWTDRFGAVRAMRLAALVSGVASAGIALVARSWVVLCLLLALGGIAHVLAQTAVNLLLTQKVRRGRQGLAFGLKQAAIPTGSFVAGLAVPLIALTVGWRWSFALVACVAVLSGLVIPHQVVESKTRQPSDVEKKAPYRGSMVLLAAALFFAMAASSTLNAFVVDAAVRGGVPVGLSGLLLTLGSLVAILVRVAVGAWADHRDGSTLKFVAYMLFMSVPGYLLLAIPDPLFLVIGTVVAFGLGWGVNGLFWLSVVRLNEATPAGASGRLMPGGLLGGLLGPIAFGWVAGTAGYMASWPISAGSAAVAGTLMLLGRWRILAERSPRVPAPES